MGLIVILILIPVILIPAGFISHSRRIGKNRYEISQLKAAIRKLEIRSEKSAIEEKAVTDSLEKISTDKPLPVVTEREKNYIRRPEIAVHSVSEKKESIPDTTAVKTGSEEKLPVKETGKPEIQPESKPSFIKQKKPSKPFLQKSDFLVKLEKLFIENWIGIIGSLVMVIGIAFLGIYAAVKLSEVFRFSIIFGIAALLFGLFLFFRRKEFWKNLALWLRSASAAVVMFACLGAGFIPGLRFITSPVPATMVLFTGIALNVVFAFISANQLFAGLHTLFSLAALLVLKQDPAILMLAAGIALCGIIITFIQKWEFHLLVTISLFFAFTMSWVFRNNPVPVAWTRYATAAVLLVHIPAILIHYRKMFSDSGFSVKSFIIHLLNWIYLTVSLIMLSTGSRWDAFILLAAAAGVFVLARLAKVRRIRWLYVTDTLVAQSVAYAAAVEFSAIVPDPVLITVILIIETFIFCSVMLAENEKKLYQFGQICLNILGVLFGGLFIYKAFDTCGYEWDPKLLNLSLLAILPVLSQMLFSLILEGKHSRIFGQERKSGFKTIRIIPLAVLSAASCNRTVISGRNT